MSQMLSAKVQHSSNVWHAFRQFDSKGKKFTRGYNRDQSKVTFPFDQPPRPSKGSTFELRTTSKVKKQIQAFNGGTFGDFIHKQAEFHNTMNDMQLDANHDNLVQQRDAEILNKHMFEEKKKNATSGSLDETDGKKLKKHGRKIDELNREIDALVKQIHEHYCSFMGNDSNKYRDIVNTDLMQPTNHVHPCYDMKKVAYFWDATLNEVSGRAEVYDEHADDQTYSDPHIKFLWTMVREEKEVFAQRGLTLEGVKECIRKHAISVGGCERAEIQRRYMLNNGLFPSCLTLPVKSFAEVLVEMNKNLPLLPCARDNDFYKDRDDVPWGNTQLTQMELCNTLLDSMPREVQQQFAVQNPLRQLRFDVYQLSTELQPLVDQIRSKKQAEKNSGGGKGGNSNSNANSRNGGGNRGNRNGSNSSGGTNTQHCDRCSKWGGNPKTHKTTDCQAWNNDGSEGPRNPNKRRKKKEVHNVDMETIVAKAVQKELRNHSRGSRDRGRSRKKSKHRRKDRSRSRSRSSSYDSYDSDE